MWYDLISTCNVSVRRIEHREGGIKKADRSSAINWENDNGNSDQSGNYNGGVKW